jgi:hypothetical protein
VQDVAAEEASLREAYAADPSDGNRRALARFLIRHGDADDGRALVAGRDAAPDLALVLEADRAEGDAGLARELAGRLLATGHDPYADAKLWTLAGFMCLELDPGNHGLRIHLQLMKAAGD